MRLRTALAGFLLLAVSCNERGALTKAQGVPVDQRYGIARLDSAFALNDPYAGFERPVAAVSATPVAIRDLFRKDLEAMFGPDSFARAQLDSGREIILFRQQLDSTLVSYVLHVSDIVSGDRYFMYLAQGSKISPKPWEWNGPQAGGDRPLGDKALPQVEFHPSTRTLFINEWRHNGNVYAAWVRTLLAVDPDLILRQEFRFEPFSISPGDTEVVTIRRNMHYIRETGQYEVRAAVKSGATWDEIGYVALSRSGKTWKITGRTTRARMKRYERLLWSANPLGEAAILDNQPPEPNAPAPSK